jgi:hypothetical protein
MTTANENQPLKQPNSSENKNQQWLSTNYQPTENITTTTTNQKLKKPFLS